MIKGLWGKKIGMTQIFSENNKVVPVTVIDASKWRVVHIKTPDRDGYHALQIGCVRDDYAQQEFSPEWLKNQKEFFCVVREIPFSHTEGDANVVVGQSIDLATVLNAGDAIDIVGTTIGRGFQGVVKRYGFSGGRGGHGDKLGRAPGSLSFMRRQGRVVKGKRMPGHMGVSRCVIKNLKVMKIEPETNVIFVKGSVPGKTGSLVFVCKHG